MTTPAVIRKPHVYNVLVDGLKTITFDNYAVSLAVNNYGVDWSGNGAVLASLDGSDELYIDGGISEMYPANFMHVKEIQLQPFSGGEGCRVTIVAVIPE